MSRTLRLSLVLLFIVGGLAACGKRGHLDPPPAQKQTRQDDGAGAPSTESGAQQNKAGRIKRVPITAPKRELLIDRILD